MNSRFEILIPASEYNLFAIDDYLRSIRTPEARQRLIRRVGYSAEKRSAFERKLNLPRGAVELAMMAEDQRLKDMSERMTRKLAASMKKQVSPQETRKFYLEVDSMMNGLQALYPDALQFMKQYGMVAQRNKASFQGDYQFGNEYRIMMVNALPPRPDDCEPNAWWCTESYVFTWSLAMWQIFGAVWLSLLLYMFVVWFAFVTAFLKAG